MITVKIDSREKDRIKSATQYYKEQGLEVSVEELEIGDYIFTDGTNEVVFEFKLISDFITSIQDHRVFNQSIEMAENYDYSFVIIHGDLQTRSKYIAMSRNYREVSVFQYIGAISSLNRYVTVLQCYSPFINESYYTMLTQARKCLQNKPIVKKFPRKHKNACFNYLAYCVYGVSAKRATDICHYLDIHTLEDLLNITHQQLTSIDGIGEKLADRIITTISNDTYES
jgi:ERCC4-type nuclease